MFAIPTLADLVQRARSAFAANLPGVAASAPGNNIGPTAKVIAQAVWDLFGRLAWVHRQIFVSTASWETLVRKGGDLGYPPRPAAPAAGEIDLVWSAPIQVAAGARFQRADGVAYLATQSFASLDPTGAATIAAQAAAPAATGDAEAGAPLAAVAGVSGAGAATLDASVGAGGMIGGLDVEDIEAYRARLLFRLRFPPQGGAASDYVHWMLRAPGVTRVYVERLWRGPGTVRVFPVLDGLRRHGVPDAADLARARDALALVQPASAGVTVEAASPHLIDVTISGLEPSDAATRSAIIAALDAMFVARGRVSGVDAGSPGMPFLAAPLTFSRSWIGEAISSASGERRHALIAPSVDVAIPAGSLPARGDVAFLP